MFENIDTFIFDFDNTIVDEDYWIKNRWKKTIIFCEKELNINEFGIHFWNVYKKKGPRYKFHINDVCEILSFSKNYIKIIVNNFLNQQFKDKYLENFYKFFSLIKKKNKTALITNGIKEIQKQRLSDIDILKEFDHIVYGDKLKKPSIKIFTKTIRLLDSSIERSIYIGDNYEIDCIAPLRLGMKALHLTNNPINIVNKNYYFFKTYNDLIDIYNGA